MELSHAQADGRQEEERQEMEAALRGMPTEEAKELLEAVNREMVAIVQRMNETRHDVSEDEAVAETEDLAAAGGDRVAESGVGTAEQERLVSPYILPFSGRAD